MAETFSPTILIVDDSQTTRAMIKRVIGMMHLDAPTLLEADNGAAALRQLETNQINLVLADLNMPVMDGFELIDRMRQSDTWRNIPVAVISAQPDPQKIEQLKRNGVVSYLAKPFTAESARKTLLPLLQTPPPQPPPQPKPVAAQPAEPVNMTLAEALAEALETMAFISPQLLPADQTPALPAGSRLIRIQFKGSDTQGSLALAASKDFADAMASNLNVSGDSAADDALKELANVTCGLLLRMRPGGGAGFHLDPPQLSSSNETTPSAIFHGGDLIALEAEGQVIAAQVITDSHFYGA